MVSFRCLACVETRGSTKGTSLAAAITLAHASVLTVIIHARRVIGVHVCLWARYTVILNLVSKQKFTNLCERLNSYPYNVWLFNISLLKSMLRLSEETSTVLKSEAFLRKPARVLLPWE